MVSGLQMIGIALLSEIGVVDIDEAREMLGLPKMTSYRLAQLKRAANWTESRAMRLPGYCLHVAKAVQTDVDQS